MLINQHNLALKKNDCNTDLLLLIRRTKKKEKRKRKNKQHTGNSSKYILSQSIRVKYEKKLIENYKSKLFDFLIDKEFFQNLEKIGERIIIPEDFSFESNYEESIELISQIIYAYWFGAHTEIIIDFDNCKKVDQSALFVLQIMRLELQEEINKLNQRLTTLNFKVKILVEKSKTSQVNLYLILCGLLIPDKNYINDDVIPIDSMGYLKGSKQQRAYLENKKGINATKIVNYVNKCLQRNSFELNENGMSDITNLIGEILNNAEDHSPFTTYYVTANYSQNKCQNEVVGELNLCFMNFGYSISEGLIENREENTEMYSQLVKVGEEIIKEGIFTKENLFTLYSLQDGVSRLKYIDESRGTGTMKFINCFFSIGDYENHDTAKKPQLSILSGKTYLVCDTKYKPFFKDNRFFLSLNDENDLVLPPNKSHLRSLKLSFPGTLLSVKVYLNKEHMTRKIEQNGNA